MRKKKKSPLSKAAIFIVIVLVFAISLISINLFVELQEQKKLSKEIQEISEIMDAKKFNKEDLNKHMKTYVTNGDYKKVEKSYKEFLTENQIIINEIVDFFKNDKSDSILTINNYKTDGKQFKKSLEQITKSKERLTELKSKYENQFSDKKIMSYINDKKLSKYYTTYYKNQIVSSVKYSKYSKELLEQMDVDLKLMGKIEQVLNFLVKNSSSWQVDDDSIYFESDELTKSYNDMLKEIKDI